MTPKRILCEEHQPVRLVEAGAGSDGITRSQLDALIATWRATTGRDPGKAFEYGPGFVKPTNWVGSVSAGDVTIEVIPRGASNLDTPDRELLDRNLGEMLHLALSYEPLRLGSGEVSRRGSRFERAVEALCDLIRIGRRKQVIRKYRVREEATRSSRGQLRFPAQAVVAIQRPGFMASRWVELSEDTPENRFLKAALAHSRGRVGGTLRRQVDEILVELDGAAEPDHPHLEYERIQLDRIPREYVEAIELGKSILDGGAAGILAGNLASRSEVLFMPALFQGFVGRLVERFAAEGGYAYDLELRGRHLSKWLAGPFAGSELVELIPDAEVSIPPDPNPVIILDAKWKAVRPGTQSMGLSASDVHQMAAYAARLGCERVALAYPWLGREPPLSPLPVMRVGLGSSSVRCAILFVPLLWGDVEDAVANFANGLKSLMAS